MGCGVGGKGSIETDFVAEALGRVDDGNGAGVGEVVWKLFRRTGGFLRVLAAGHEGHDGNPSMPAFFSIFADLPEVRGQSRGNRTRGLWRLQGHNPVRF